MEDLVCPNCNHPLAVTVRSAGHRVAKADRALVPQWYRPFKAWLNRLEPGRYKVADLHQAYAAWALTQTGVTEIPDSRALGKILSSWGFKRYRGTGGVRGFIIDGPREVVADDETGRLRVVSPGSADA
jgi:hypothetical protein